MERKNKIIKVAIAVVAVLLAVSLIALGRTIFSEYILTSEPSYVIVPDNYISNRSAAAVGKKSNAGFMMLSTADMSGGSDAVMAKVVRLSESGGKTNERFYVTNMFPGDTYTQYYCVRFVHENTAALKFTARVHEGGEKLGEVLALKVEQLNSGVTVYDGFIDDIPTVDVADFTGMGSEEIYFAITASLDTSVGNEYMNKELYADFIWWVEEEASGGGGGRPSRPSDTTQDDTSDSDTDDTRVDDTDDTHVDDTDDTRVDDTDDTHVDDTNDTHADDTDNTRVDDTDDTHTDDTDDTRADDTDDTRVDDTDDTRTDDTDDESAGDTDDDWNGHASQTGDELIVRMRIAMLGAVSALLLLILLLLIRSKDDEDEEEQA